jgi:Linear amide C-N hydrolases, choloylglycine hydrolase family
MNKRMLSILIYVTCLILCTFSVIYPCTTFILHQRNHLIFGRNLDWITGTGLVMINPRNLEKVALVDPSEKPVKWISKFGSITFNQVGRDLPYGGMNESGLVVEHMTLDKTAYPSKDNRYTIGACQWIQFQLDNYSTIEEVMSSDTLLRIFDAVSNFHFLICDRFGHAVTIEFLNGKMVCHTGKNLPVRVLANSTYEESLSCYNNNGDIQSNRSLYNFCTAAHLTDNPDFAANDSIIDYAFRALHAVNQGLGTKWTIVYDITNMKIYFKVFETPTIVGEKKIFLKQPPYNPITKVVDFKGLDFDCSDAAKVLDLECNYEGAVNQYLVNYSTSMNKKFISKAFTFFKGWGGSIVLKDEEMEYLARYPETFKCVVNK